VTIGVFTFPAGAPADGAVAVYRRALFAFAGAGTAGTAVELAMLRHWKSTEQLIPWFALGILTAMLIVSLVRPALRSNLAVRISIVLVAAASVWGAVQHVKGNYDAGPLDAVYGDKWDAMSTVARIWTAATGGVGPSPTLAPFVLAQAAVCLWLAWCTINHISDGLTHPTVRR